MTTQRRSIADHIPTDIAWLTEEGRIIVDVTDMWQLQTWMRSVSAQHGGGMYRWAIPADRRDDLLPHLEAGIREREECAREREQKGRATRARMEVEHQGLIAASGRTLADGPIKSWSAWRGEPGDVTSGHGQTWLIVASSKGYDDENDYQAPYTWALPVAPTPGEQAAFDAEANRKRRQAAYEAGRQSLVDQVRSEGERRTVIAVAHWDWMERTGHSTDGCIKASLIPRHSLLSRLEPHDEFRVGDTEVWYLVSDLLGDQRSGWRVDRSTESGERIAQALLALEGERRQLQRL